VNRALPSVTTAAASAAAVTTTAGCAAFDSATGSSMEPQPASTALDIHTAEIDLVAMDPRFHFARSPTGIILV
jgi:hypothetical protein